MARARSELEDATSTAEQLAAQQQQGSELVGELRQLLDGAEQQLLVARSEEAALRSRCEELEAGLAEAQAAAEADSYAAEEARAAAEEAQQQAQHLRRRLGIAEAQVGWSRSGSVPVLTASSRLPAWAPARRTQKRVHTLPAGDVACRAMLARARFRLPTAAPAPLHLCIRWPSCSMP